MREIKFRAWDIERKKMSNPNDYMSIGLPCTTEVKIGEDRDYKAILMQYTGLKDKNGREIYEGDILGYPNPKARYQVKCGKATIGVEEYDQAFVGFYKESPYGEKLFLEQEEHFEIIGNIYENPKMLK